MKKGIFDKRIPTIAALIFLLIAVAVTIVLIQSGVIYIGRATPEPVPQNPQVTNVTDTSFSVIYTTSELYEGAIAIKNSNTGNTIFLDDRDRSSGVKNKYYSHHITALNLNPQTTYTFDIISGNNTYKDTSYTVTTGSSIENPPPSQNPLYGKVLNSNGEPSSDSLVIAKTKDALIVSSYTDDEGEFIIPTNSIRNLQNNKYFLLNSDSEFEITVIRKDQKSTVMANFDIAQNLPTILLDQEYTLTDEEETTTAPPQLSVSSNTLNTPLTITIPSDGETFTDLRPMFEGTALPDSSVRIDIDGKTASDVLADASGVWSYRIEDEFSPGQYLLTVTSVNEQGDSISESSSFAIFPQGSQVFSEQLNPTTTPTEIPTQTPTPTTTPTPSPTPTTTQPTPTIEEEPTPTEVVPTPTESPTPLPTIPVTPTAVPPIDPPGVFDNSIAVTAVSVSLLIVGSLLFLLF